MYPRSPRTNFLQSIPILITEYCAVILERPLADLRFIGIYNKNA